MRGTKRLVLWLRGFTARPRVERELDEEMRFHLEMEAEKLVRRGIPASEANRRARLAFGSVEHHKEAMREGRGVRSIERIGFDVRLAVRQLRKTPGFTLAAALTLALGIGGNAAIFSVVNGVLLRPLAYPEPDRIMTIAHRTSGGELPERLPNSSAAHVVYEEGNRSFEAMALYATWQGSLTGPEASPDWVDVVTATRSLFDVLRVPPTLGRTFSADEDRPRGPRVAVLSHTLWQQRFGGDSAIIGRSITLDGVVREVVGVMPQGFAFPTPESQVWVPMRVDRTNLGGFYLGSIGRLRAGVTPAAASTELATLLPRAAQLVDFLTEKALRDAGIRPDVHPYLDDVVAGIRPTLWTLWAMVGLVLLIACVNVACLLLVRAESRRREVALRVALGAARGHLLAQSLAESAMLVAFGSAAGVAVAWLAVGALSKLAPGSFPRIGEVRVDALVIAATTFVAMIVAVVFGVVPVARHRTVGPSAMLRGGGRSATTDRRSGRVRQALVIAQVAMATVLLVASGLVLRSFQKLRAVDPGFRAEGAVTFRVAVPSSRYQTPSAVAQFHYTLLDRIGAIPGVRVVGATGRLPLAGVQVEMDPLRLDGRVFPPNMLPPLAEMRVATPGYFEAMGIPLRAGRLLDRSDTEQPSSAVLVSESVVRKLMESREPVGARVAHGLAGVRGEQPWSTVVGVVGDVHGKALDEPPIGAVYYAMVNRPGVDKEWLARSMAYVVRTDVPAAALVASVRRELARLDPTIPLAETRTLSSVMDGARRSMRFSTICFAVAALVGLFMGAIGLYGVLSYVTAQRTREIGVRMALGATPASVRGTVLRRGVAVSVAGLAVGMVVALSLRVVAKPLLYGVSPADPITLVAVCAVLLVVGVVATWLPARRAARLDPVKALRFD